jgi:hypothetical protein
MKASGKPSNWLAENFRLYRKQHGNERVDVSSNCLAMEQNEAAGLPHDHRENKQKIRAGV